MPKGRKMQVEGYPKDIAVRCYKGESLKQKLKKAEELLQKEGKRKLGENKPITWIKYIRFVGFREVDNLNVDLVYEVSVISTNNKLEAKA